MDLHDSEILKCEFDFIPQKIKLHAKSKNGFFQVVFTNVALHSLYNFGVQNVLFTIYENTIQDFEADNPAWQEDNAIVQWETPYTEDDERDLHYFVLESSYNLTGFIVAESMKIITPAANADAGFGLFLPGSVACLTATAPPATEEEILAVEDQLGLLLPDIYKAFLRSTNGAATDHCTLYSTEEMIEMNRLNEVQEYAPGYVSIGNDGGGYQLMMRAELQEEEVHLVDDGYGVPSEEDTILPSFEEWLLQSEDGDPWAG